VRTIGPTAFLFVLHFRRISRLWHGLLGQPVTEKPDYVVVTGPRGGVTAVGGWPSVAYAHAESRVECGLTGRQRDKP
jgi:hypothetical protein